MNTLLIFSLFFLSFPYDVSSQESKYFKIKKAFKSEYFLPVDSMITIDPYNHLDGYQLNFTWNDNEDSSICRVDKRVTTLLNQSLPHDKKGIIQIFYASEDLAHKKILAILTDDSYFYFYDLNIVNDGDENILPFYKKNGKLLFGISYFTLASLSKCHVIQQLLNSTYENYLAKYYIYCQLEWKENIELGVFSLTYVADNNYPLIEGYLFPNYYFHYNFSTYIADELMAYYLPCTDPSKVLPNDTIILLFNTEKYINTILDMALDMVITAESLGNEKMCIYNLVIVNYTIILSDILNNNLQYVTFDPNTLQISQIRNSPLDNSIGVLNLIRPAYYEDFTPALMISSISSTTQSIYILDLTDNNFFISEQFERLYDDKYCGGLVLETTMTSKFVYSLLKVPISSEKNKLIMRVYDKKLNILSGNIYDLDIGDYDNVETFSAFILSFNYLHDQVLYFVKNRFVILDIDSTLLFLSGSELSSSDVGTLYTPSLVITNDADAQIIVDFNITVMPADQKYLSPKYSFTEISLGQGTFLMLQLTAMFSGFLNNVTIQCQNQGKQVYYSNIEKVKILKKIDLTIDMGSSQLSHSIILSPAQYFFQIQDFGNIESDKSQYFYFSIDSSEKFTNGNRNSFDNSVIEKKTKRLKKNGLRERYIVIDFELEAIYFQLYEYESQYYLNVYIIGNNDPQFTLYLSQHIKFSDTIVSAFFLDYSNQLILTGYTDNDEGIAYIFENFNFNFDDFEISFSLQSTINFGKEIPLQISSYMNGYCVLFTNNELKFYTQFNTLIEDYTMSNIMEYEVYSTHEIIVITTEYECKAYGLWGVPTLILIFPIPTGYSLALYESIPVYKITDTLFMVLCQKRNSTDPSILDYQLLVFVINNEDIAKGLFACYEFSMDKEVNYFGLFTDGEYILLLSNKNGLYLQLDIFFEKLIPPLPDFEGNYFKDSNITNTCSIIANPQWFDSGTDLQINLILNEYPTPLRIKSIDSEDTIILESDVEESYILLGTYFSGFNMSFNISPSYYGLEAKYGITGSSTKTISTVNLNDILLVGNYLYLCDDYGIMKYLVNDIHDVVYITEFQPPSNSVIEVHPIAFGLKAAFIYVVDTDGLAYFEAYIENDASSLVLVYKNMLLYSAPTIEYNSLTYTFALLQQPGSNEDTWQQFMLSVAQLDQNYNIREEIYELDNSNLLIDYSGILKIKLSNLYNLIYILNDKSLVVIDYVLSEVLVTIEFPFSSVDDMILNFPMKHFIYTINNTENCVVLFQLGNLEIFVFNYSSNITQKQTLSNSSNYRPYLSLQKIKDSSQAFSRLIEKEGKIYQTNLLVKYSNLSYPAYGYQASFASIADWDSIAEIYLDLNTIRTEMRIIQIAEAQYNSIMGFTFPISPEWLQYTFNSTIFGSEGLIILAFSDHIELFRFSPRPVLKIWDDSLFLVDEVFSINITAYNSNTSSNYCLKLNMLYETEPKYKVVLVIGIMIIVLILLFLCRIRNYKVRDSNSMATTIQKYLPGDQELMTINGSISSQQMN